MTAAASGMRGPGRLVLELPAGVILTGATGSWSDCDQDGTTVTCVGPASDSGRWAGTVTTAWVDDARGRVRATVSGTYANGSPAVGSVGTTWPP